MPGAVSASPATTIIEYPKRRASGTTAAAPQVEVKNWAVNSRPASASPMRHRASSSGVIDPSIVVATPVSTKATLSLIALLQLATDAGAVDSRTTGSGTAQSSLGESAPPAMRCSKVSAARKPMRVSGWRTVVNAGLWNAAP